MVLCEGGGQLVLALPLASFEKFPEEVNEVFMKPTHGGKRKKSGRKPVADKKVQVSFYIESSKIEKLGGLDTF